MKETRLSRRQVLKLLAVGAAGAAIEACAPQVVKETVVVEKVVTPTPAPKEKVKLRFTTVGWGGWLSEPWIEMVKQFNESQGDITAEYQDIAEGYEKVMAEAVGGVAADAYTFETKWVYSFAAKGFFLPLEELVANSTVIKEEDYFAEDWKEMWWGGHMFVVPFDNSPAMIWYNPDLFDAAGVPYPPDHFGEWKWADFLETALKLTTGEGAERVFGWAGERWWVYPLNWIWSNGGMFLNEYKTKCVISSPETKEALQWAADLVHKYKVQPMADQIIQGGNSAMFMGRRAAMAQRGTWWAIDLKAASKESGLKWNVAPMPDGKAGSFIRNPLDGFTIWQGSPRRQEAWQLIEFLSRPEIMSIIVRSGLSSSRKDIMLGDVFLKQEPTDVHWYLFAEALDGHVRQHPDTAIFPQMQDLTQPAWEAVLDGASTVDEMVEKIEGPINDLLAECIAEGNCLGEPA
jgi:multiple sugar transport system substrate-binding protein